MQLDRYIHNLHFRAIVTGMVKQPISFHLSSFYVCLLTLKEKNADVSLVQHAIDNLSMYDALLSLNDAEKICIEADLNYELLPADYGVLIAMYGEVDWDNSPAYNRDVLVDALRFTDFYDAAILNGSIEAVLHTFIEYVDEEYRKSWYNTALECILSKKKWLELKS